MNCEDIARILDEREVDGLLSEELSDVRVHLAVCRDCSRVWKIHERLKNTGIPAVPGELRALYSKQAASASHVGAYRRSRFVLIGLVVAAAAAAATLTAELMKPPAPLAAAPSPVPTESGAVRDGVDAFPAAELHAPVPESGESMKKASPNPSAADANPAQSAFITGVANPFGFISHGVGPGAQFGKQTIERSYPDLQQQTGFTSADVDALAELIGSNAWESEYQSRLGAEKYQLWKEYQNSVVARDGTKRFSTALSKTNDPLRDDQAASLYATVLAETRRSGEERVKLSPSTDPRAQLSAEFEENRIVEDSTRRVIDSAKSYLSPAQLAALQNSAYVEIVQGHRRWLEARRAQLDREAGR